jgi:ABC-type branched-subunit amino acid transport system substrate-binding protein
MGHARMDCQVSAAEHYGFQVVNEEFAPATTTELYPIATKIMATDPDFFVGAWQLLAVMQEMGFKGLSAYNLWFSTTGTVVGIDKFQGHLCYLPLSWGEGVPSALAEFATEYQELYGEPCELCSWYAALVVYTLTSIVQQAGTVDDMDKILATIDTGTFDTVLLGEMRFFGEELCGLNRILLWPIQIHEWSGDQPRVVFTMDPEDAYELVLELKGQPGY